MGNNLSITSINESYKAPLKRIGIITEPFQGYGTFFMTLRGKNIRNNEDVIVKVFQYDQPLNKFEGVNKSDRFFKLLNEKNKETLNVVKYTDYAIQEGLAYLVRHRFERSLVDFVTFQQPMLDPSEKLFVFFQIAKAMKSLHDCGLSHGDLKPNNIFVGRNLMTYITDPAPFKPLIVEQPHIFNHYFVTDSGSGCYLAPERTSLYSNEEVNLVYSDYFSLGCILAFIYLNGHHLFNFNSLIQYKNGNFDLDKALVTIEDKQVVALIKDLLTLNPLNRAKTVKKMFKSFDSFLDQTYLMFSQLTGLGRNLFILDTEAAFVTFIQLSNQCPDKYKIILFDYISDQLLINRSANTIIIPVITYLKDFSLSLSDDLKLTKVIPAFVYFLDENISSTNICYVSISSIINVLKTIKEIPTHFADYFKMYLIPNLLKLLKFQDKKTLTLLADKIPYVYLQIRRLSPSSVDNFPAKFSSIYTSNDFQIFKCFSNSFKSIAKESGFIGISSFLTMFYTLLNKAEEFYIEIIDILYIYYKNSPSQEFKKFQEFTLQSILPIIKEIINGKHTDELLLNTFHFLEYLFTNKFIDEELGYSLYFSVNKYTDSSNPILRYYTNKLILSFPDDVKKFNEYTSYSKVDKFIKIYDNKVKKNKEHGFELEIQQRKIYKMQKFMLKFTPKFLTSFHEDKSSMNFILKNSDSKSIIVVNNDNKVRWINIVNNENKIIKPEQFRTHISKKKITSAQSISPSNYVLKMAQLNALILQEKRKLCLLILLKIILYQLHVFEELTFQIHFYIQN